ncbi:MAG: DoxX family protein [Pyrinomonadaceae bacterium]
MNLLLWILQIVATLLYTASGVMKVFMFDTISVDVPSFGALPKQVWMALGLVELVCAACLIIPSAIRVYPIVTVIAALLLATESLLFVWVHVKYNETGSIIMVCVLGLLMAFIAYGRYFLKPIG